MTPDPPDDARRRVSVAHADEPPPHAPFDLSIAVTDPWITPRSTATLAATIQNTGAAADTFKRAFYKGSSEDHGGPPGMLLYSTDAADAPPADYAPACLTDDGSGTTHRPERAGRDRTSFTLELPSSPHLAPGESATETLLVVDDPTADGCVPEGSYQFWEYHSIEAPPESRHSVEELRQSDHTFVWDFTVEVEALE